MSGRSADTAATFLAAQVTLIGAPMGSITLLALAVTILPAFGVAAWLWLANAREDYAPRSPAGPDGMYFEH